MGRFDKIQETPDFWTSALNSFGENYDRLIQAEEMNKQDERYNQQQSIANRERIKEEQRYNEQTFTERKRYNEQQKLAKQEKDREEWQYMLEGAKNDKQRALIYKNGLNNNISGLTAAGLTALNDSALIELNINEDISNFYTQDDKYKHENGSRIVSNLIKNNKLTQAAQIEKEMKEARGNVENKEVIQMISEQYGDVFSPQLKTFFEQQGDISDSQLNMGIEMMKTSQSYKLKSMQEKYDLAQSLIGMTTKGEFPTEQQSQTVGRANFVGYQLMKEISPMLNLGELGGEETPESPPLELSNFDKRITGKDDSFDSRTEEDKRKIFNAVASKYKDEYESDAINIGKKIIDEINKTKYRTPSKASGFGGVEYRDPEEVVNVTQSMIDEEVKSLKKSKRIPKGQQDNPRIIEQLQSEARKNVEDRLEKESRKRARSIAQSTQREESIMGK